jgi:FkbM family methyltransferase
MKNIIYLSIFKFCQICIPQSLQSYLLNILLKLRGYNNYKNFNESGEKYFLNKVLAKHEPKICIDVGSNIGNYAKEILTTTNSKVISFEPLKEPFKKLEELKVIWGDRLILVNKGLGARESRKKIYFNKESLSHASFVKEISNLSYISNHREEEVLVTTLDNFIEQNSINSPIDYIKIDTEGFEYDVLLGCKNIIKFNRPKFIHIEFNWHQLIKSQTLYSFSLLLSEYDIFQMLPNGLVKRDPIDPISNIYSYSNFAFVRKDLSIEE